MNQPKRIIQVICFVSLFIFLTLFIMLVVNGGTIDFSTWSLGNYLTSAVYVVLVVSGTYLMVNDINDEESKEKSF